jgi:hypothetical protein
MWIQILHTCKYIVPHVFIYNHVYIYVYNSEI